MTAHTHCQLSENEIRDEVRKAPRSRRRRRRGDGKWGGGIPLPSRLGGLGSVVSSPSWVRVEPRPQTNMGHIISVSERLWLKENHILCATFIMAYTSTRTVTEHQLAKIAPVHYYMNSKAKIEGEKPEIRIVLHITFCAVKIRDMSLSRTEPFGTRDAASEFGTVPKNSGRLATVLILALPHSLWPRPHSWILGAYF